MQIVINTPHRMNLLMDEILEKHPDLRGTKNELGIYEDPKIKAITRNGESIITISDDLDLTSIINQHNPNKLTKAEEKQKAKTEAKEAVKKDAFKSEDEIEVLAENAFPTATKDQGDFLKRLARLIMNLQKSVLED